MPNGSFTRTHPSRSGIVVAYLTSRNTAKTSPSPSCSGRENTFSVPQVQRDGGDFLFEAAGEAVYYNRMLGPVAVSFSEARNGKKGRASGIATDFGR